jgi:hypothetical protein
MILRQVSIIIALVLLLAACSTHIERTQTGDFVSDCHIVYDAGSSKTRLFIYEQSATAWLQHRGPKTDALADPVRGHRGKTMADAGGVVDDVVTALENMRRIGPPDKNDEPEWPAYDWKKHCDIKTVAVYATAGMRIAEQQDAAASELLWKMLNERLSDKLKMSVTTRALSEYEEGLYAWLAKREGQGDGEFGIAEMGGASIQIAFPCPECPSSKQVRVKGGLLPIYSRSVLGWGQDEAWKKFGDISACKKGVGMTNPDWEVSDCATGMEGFSDTAAEPIQYVSTENGLRWYLSDAFRYMKATDIDQFCRQGIDSGFMPESSCFRAVYLQEVLDTLGLPADSETSDVNWTLGAVVCTATRCLEIK